MLTEIKNLRQIHNEPERRWFNSEDMDLFIWCDNNDFIGFQICYDKTASEKALSWKPSTGLVHQQVDDGESRAGRYKATPILIENGRFDLEKIRNDFEYKSKNIPIEVRDFVLDNLFI